jgi:hypothetical protein
MRRVVAGIGQGVAAGMPEHVGVDSGQSASPADALDVAIDGVRRERPSALSREDEARARELPAQLAQRADLIVAEPMGRRFAVLGAADVERGSSAAPALDRCDVHGQVFKPPISRSL